MSGKRGWRSGCATRCDDEVGVPAARLGVTTTSLTCKEFIYPVAPPTPPKPETRLCMTLSYMA